MDIYCANCREPWEDYHMRHDAINDTEISAVDLMVWRGLSSKQKTEEPYKTLLKDAGYIVGNSMLHLIQCPNCYKEPVAPESLTRQECIAAVTDLMGDDEDGLACMLEDFEASEDARLGLTEQREDERMERVMAGLDAKPGMWAHVGSECDADYAEPDADNNIYPHHT